MIYIFWAIALNPSAFQPIRLCDTDESQTVSRHHLKRRCILVNKISI